MGQVKEAVLRLKLVDGVSGPAGGIRGALDKLDSKISGFDRAIRQTRGQLFNAAGVAVAAGAALAVPVRRAMQFESAMADVRKVVDFESPEAFEKMSSDILDLSKRLPMTAEGIAAIVAAAGQSGLANNELLEFAEVAAKVGVAWDVSADEAGEALAKLKTSLSLSVADTQLLADAVNHLGNKTAGSAPDILNFTRRVAPMAGQFGLTAQQAAALGSAMIGSGFEAEVAATSFLNMGRALTAGASATKRQRAAYKALGLDSKQVAIDMQKDAVGTLDKVLARLREAPDHVRASLMTDIFGAEARALGPLVANAELFAQVLDLVADKLTYAGSAQAEFAERAKTTENSLQLLRNRITATGIAFGTVLLPAVNDAAGALGPVIDRITGFIRANPHFVKAAVGATAALIGLRVAALAGKLGLLLVGRQGLVAARGVLAAGLAVSNVATAAARFSAAGIVAGFAAAGMAPLWGLTKSICPKSSTCTQGRPAISQTSMGPAIDRANAHDVLQPVIRMRPAHRDQVSAVNQPPAVRSTAHRQGDEMDPCGLLVEFGRQRGDCRQRSRSSGRRQKKRLQIGYHRDARACRQGTSYGAHRCHVLPLDRRFTIAVDPSGSAGSASGSRCAANRRSRCPARRLLFDRIAGEAACFRHFAI